MWAPRPSTTDAGDQAGWEESAQADLVPLVAREFIGDMTALDYQGRNRLSRCRQVGALALLLVALVVQPCWAAEMRAWGWG